jgi:hypothetical protein
MSESVTINICRADLNKMGSNSLLGIICNYCRENDKPFPKDQEVIIRIEQRHVTSSITIPDYLISCLLEDVAWLAEHGCKVRIKPFYYTP